MFDLIIKNPFSFLLVCCGLSLVLHKIGAKDFFPNLLHFLEVILNRLIEEFTKGKNRSHSEWANFILIVFFAFFLIVSAFCLLIPPAIVQVFGMNSVTIHDSVIYCLVLNSLFLFLSALYSPLVIKIIEKGFFLHNMKIPDNKETPNLNRS